MPLIVAEKDGEAVGYGTYGSFRFKKAYQFTIELSVYVSHNFRRIGVGKLILKELIRIAKKEGYHVMIAGLDASNRGSFEFHKKNGFMEVGTFKEVGFKFDEWVDLTFMQLYLE